MNKLTDVDLVEDVASQIEALSNLLDLCSDEMSHADWQRLVELIPWHENIPTGPCTAIRALAADMRK